MINFCMARCILYFFDEFALMEGGDPFIPFSWKEIMVKKNCNEINKT